MNKTLIAGLAGTSLVLALALAFTLGTQNGAIQQNVASLGQPEWATTMMGNRQANSRFSQNVSTSSMNAMHQQMHSNTSSLSTSLEGTDYDLASMEAVLDVLIADEYKARAEYVALEDLYGESSPWTQLIRAETNHINALSSLYAAYGLSIPEDNGAQFAVIPDTLQAAYEIGIQAEIDNIALYEGYLSNDLPDQVEAVFTNLMNASIHHQSTFEAYASGQTPTYSQGMMGRQGRWGN